VFLAIILFLVYIYYMNSANSNQNQSSDNSSPTVIQGETDREWEKLKAYKIENGTFYTGPFATPRGNPHFGNIPIITKYIFLIIAIYYAIKKNYKYTLYALILYMIGCILNGVRFFYVNLLAEKGEDSHFLNSTVNDNIIGAVLAFIAILYILFKKNK
jgi:hypothetical protein